MTKKKTPTELEAQVKSLRASARSARREKKLYQEALEKGIEIGRRNRD